jgi:hypothetical protein
VRHNQPEAAPEADCGLLVTDRNRYFDGKFMTARDFRADPDYLLSRHRLHQRLLHGWGVVCGLRVQHHRKPECRRRWVVVTSGIAIDCCGRELVLEHDTAFELPLPEPDDQQTAQAAPAAGERPETLFVCLRYREQAVEHTPVLYHEGHCDPSRKEANRVREAPELVARTGRDFQPDCWSRPGGGMDAECIDDCGEQVPGPANVCLEPRCPCGDTVPLARVTYHPGHPERELEIDMGGRRTLPPAPQHLTHVVGTSWRHGHRLTIHDLRQRDGRLEVRFDRRLLEGGGDATGINQFTFLVEWINPLEGERDIVRYDPRHPPTVKDGDGCTAVFTIHPDYWRYRESTIAGATVYVTLKCDFILDCHHNPVDGAHLRGRLPSGDGVPGGQFESWFRVVYREEEAEQEEAS